VKGHNANSLHVSYIGGVDANGKPTDNRTPEQKATLRLVLKAWREKYPTAKIQGHRDFPGVAKACPSFQAREEYAAL
jgi:N-acetylmuramoyl-L-alanine amidase